MEDRQSGREDINISYCWTIEEVFKDRQISERAEWGSRRSDSGLSFIIIAQYLEL